MRLGVILGFFVVGLLALPGASANDDNSAQKYLDNAVSWGDIGFVIGPDSMDIQWTGLELGGNTSRAVRDLADSPYKAEEKDGMVDQAEYDHFLDLLTVLFESEFSKWANNHQYSGLVLIDDAEPQEITVKVREAKGLLGAVDQEGTITAALDARVAFPNTEEDQEIHTVTLDMGSYYFKEGYEDKAASFAKDLTLTLRGAEGWSIDDGSVQPDCAAEQYADGGITFTTEDIPCFTGRTGVLLAFTISGEAEREKSFLPGFQVIGLLGAAVVAVLGHRRRF